MDKKKAAGFSLIEMLIAMTVFVAVGTALSAMLLQNSALNRSQQLTAEVHSNARNSLSLVVAKLRSAGWDPRGRSLPTWAPDPDTADSVSQITVFADLDSDGLINTDYETLTVRHTGNQIEWRPTDVAADPFVVVASNISNDADGDGVIEPMFQTLPAGDPNPTTIRVQVTAQSPVPDPITRDFIRYTVRSDVVLRKNL